MTTSGDLAQQCLNVLRAILQPMSARATHQARNLPQGVDAVCEISLLDRSGFRFCAVVRRGLRPATLPQLLERIEVTAAIGACDQVVVFTDYVPAPLAETLQAQRVNFVDTAGNVRLAVPGQISVFHTGKRPPRKLATQGQYFTAAGAKGSLLSSSAWPEDPCHLPRRADSHRCLARQDLEGAQRAGKRQTADRPDARGLRDPRCRDASRIAGWVRSLRSSSERFSSASTRR